MIARPVNPAEVAAVISVAHESGLPLAVRSGGHSAAAHSTVDGGIVLDLRDIGLDIDVDGRTAWAETGLSAGEFTQAGAHGLAVGFGDTGSVGLGGLTLGGGVGYLSRKHGLTIDSLLAAEVVTADGEMLRVDEKSHPDLFWAIRGGGGNFGVATRFRFRLHEVTQVVGGLLVLPATAETIAGFVAAAEAAPEELTTIANVMPARRCRSSRGDARQAWSSMLLCWAGDADAGQAADRAVRPLGRADRQHGAADAYPGDVSARRPRSIARGESARRCSSKSIDLDEAAETILERADGVDGGDARRCSSASWAAQSRGSPAEATAYAHRQAASWSTWRRSSRARPTSRLARSGWRAWRAALDQGESCAYVNFVGDEGEKGVRAAYPGATWDRLAAIKREVRSCELLPSQPEHPAGVTLVDCTARAATTRTGTAC